MRIIGAMDVHRKQISFKLQDIGTGEVRRGRLPCDRESVRRWLADLRGRSDVHLALEATTGWRFVVEEIQRAGYAAHLAEPAETAARRGPKQRAKTDKTDCDNMVELLALGRLPESWIPPDHLLEVRTLVRLRKDLVDERRKWYQRIKAQLFHQGVPGSMRLTTHQGRNRLAEVELSPAGRQVAATGLRVIDHLEQQLDPLDRQLIAFAKRQPGCQALTALYGVGHLTAVAIWAELGDVRRFSNSDDAVRYAGLDITVHDSDGKRSAGHLSRQGPEVLRWALYEAAQSAARPASPDHAYYRAIKARIDHNRACLAVARKLLRRAYHILKGLGDAALEPVAIDATSKRPRGARRPLGPAADDGAESVARFAAHGKPMTFAAGSPTPPVATAAPWTSWKDRAAATLPAGSPDLSSCRRSLLRAPR